MQRGGGGRDFFGFGDPFGGFGGHGSLVSNFFGGRDPFDDPFFSRPFGSMMGPSMFGPSLLGSGGGLFGQTSNAGFLETHAQPPNKSKGPIITELLSDDEEGEEEDKTLKEKKDNPRKHSRSSKEAYIQDPDEEVGEKRTRHLQHTNMLNTVNSVHPQAQTYSFQSSTVTYGGPNGAYYTSSRTRRTGGNGVMLEESKEADTTTGQATHRISRGIRDKGHTHTRKLNSSGRVSSLQTLHNLNEDELAGFEESWKGNAKEHLPGWNQGVDMLNNGSIRNSSSSWQGEQQPSGGWALPAPEQPHVSAARMKSQSRPSSSSWRSR